MAGPGPGAWGAEVTCVSSLPSGEAFRRQGEKRWGEHSARDAGSRARGVGGGEEVTRAEARGGARGTRWRLRKLER